MNSSNDSTATLMERILYEVKRVVVGQDQFLERVMVALLVLSMGWVVKMGEGQRSLTAEYGS